MQGRIFLESSVRVLSEDMQGFRVLVRYTFCDPSLHASINTLSRARVPRTASSVRTVSVPWPGIVLMLKESEGSVSFVLARILGIPSAGEPNRIIGFLELFHLSWSG